MTRSLRAGSPCWPPRYWSGRAGSAVAPAADRRCADLGGSRRRHAACARSMTGDRRLHDGHAVPGRLPRRAGRSSTTSTRPGTGSSTSRRCPDARNLPYSAGRHLDQYSSGRPPAAPRVWCSRCSRTSAARTRLTWYKAFNYDLDTAASRSRSTRCSSRAPSRWPVIFPIVQAELETQTRQPRDDLARGDGLDPRTTRTSRSPTTR